VTREPGQRAAGYPQAGQVRASAPHPMRPPPPQPTVRGRPPRRPDAPDSPDASGAPDEPPARCVPPPEAARRAAARAEALRAYRRRGRRRLAVLVVVVAGAGWLGYQLLIGSVFGARTVDVTGTGLLSVSDVRHAADVEPGHPMLRLDLEAVAARVRALPPVAGVEVRRSWPATLTIRVTERAPVAFALVEGGAALVDGTGLRFATLAAAPPGLPELQATDGAATVAGARVLAALAAPGREGLRAEVLAAHADSPFDIRLTLRGERTVRWGSAADSDRKADVLAALLTQRGSVYDVASPLLPTIR
jgi:cell division protein FtsQ